MEIKKENVLAAYETARKAGADSTMKVLEALFGEDTFKPKDITERVKTFEDACRELSLDSESLEQKWEDDNLMPDEIVIRNSASSAPL